MPDLFRRTSLLVIGILTFYLLPVVPCYAGSSPRQVNDPVIQRLSNLDRHYNLSFLWFDHIAVGQLSFSPDPTAPRSFRAVLEAKTLGVAAWLTGDRIQSYETVMELTPQGRLLPREYRARIFKNKGGKVTEQVKLYTFDAKKRSITMTRTRDGKTGTEQSVKNSGETFPVDFLTAGFNYIIGAEGAIRVGEVTEIVTFSDEGEQKIIIEVLPANKWPKNSFFKKGTGTLLKITLPPEILDTSGGAVYALLDKKLLPVRAIVENVLGLGNVQGEWQP